ncbi:hypothetical protein [Bradyrhizobium acaciae]|uniref:hypothetical protein n=1 Tax=Bradyrhizobium acaciae TaxID=2683706 RepID=UPI001E424FC9|nr:hypothetical protein [Bradyrhizobium acaciae]MCC8978655.1 hypothetical protein [Bradyrhizobium acaciae]
MNKAIKAENQMQAARKEIRANIRQVLNTQKLGSSVSVVEAMNVLLEEKSHPIHKLFELGRLDVSNHDHWRALTFIMVDEIFGGKQRGAPSKKDGPISNVELLLYLNQIRRMRIEEGWPSDVGYCLADLPAMLQVLEENSETRELAKHYLNKKVTTLKTYVHTALTESAAHLLNPRKEIDRALAEIAEEALNNFRPDWRQGGKP